MIKREELLTPEIDLAIRQHALEAYPDESVGAIVAGVYQKLNNVYEEPTKGAKIPSQVLGKLIASGKLEAIVHSHPNGPHCPSASDMRSQMNLQVPFIIVSTNGEACFPPFAWGDMMEVPPLVGRAFQHGVTDCYALCRDYYRTEQGILLPDYPRDWEWWLKGGNLYTDNFLAAGFREISSKEVQDGDACIMRIRSEVPNHAGVIHEGLLLHHATAQLAYDPASLSKKTPLHRYLPYITHFVRYEK